MIKQFFNGGKVLLAGASIVMLSVQAFAGWGGVSSNAGNFSGVTSYMPASGSSEVSFKEARLSTDKASYLASDVVRINGEGFNGYERVRFAVGSESRDGTSALVIGQWDVYADGKGRVETTWDVPSSDTYSVTATGDVSGLIGKIEINPEAESVSLAQCANTNADPQNLDCPNAGPSGWVTGLVGDSKAKYFEGQFIAYRNVMEGLTVGHQYKWTVEYDVTKAGINAIDYLGTFNHSISNANPCADGNNASGFCTAGAADSTFPIPTDPKVTAGRDQTPATSDDITQIPGVISAWGGTLSAVSVPSYSGPFPVGDESATVDITFTATSSTVVIAWGGHISTRSDWGPAFGSVNITGAPYHTSNEGLMNLTAQTTCCNGSQDLQLSAVAVIPSARLTIVKQASPPSAYQFFFTTTGLALANFSLYDDDTNIGNSIAFDGISDFGDKVITELDPDPFDLTSVTCVGATSFTPNVPGGAGGSVTVNIQSGDDATCTFNNSFLTAAEATVQGRVTVAGRPLAGAWVSATDGNGNTRFARTNMLGFYSIRELEAGTSLFVDVAHKSYVFTSRFVTLNDEVNNVDFNGTAR